MNSYLFDIGDRARKVSRFVFGVRNELQKALFIEKKSRKLSQQAIAQLIGVNRSVINRQIVGTENLTIRRVAELAWAMGWNIEFKMTKDATIDLKQVARVTMKADILTAPSSSQFISTANIDDFKAFEKSMTNTQDFSRSISVTNDNRPVCLLEYVA